MAFWSRLTGGNPGKEGDAAMYVFGRDQHFCRRKLEAGGSHFQDNTRLLAYYSSPGCVGEQLRKSTGHTRPAGPISIAYELITGLWHFPTLGWHEKMQPQAGKSESDMVLDNGLAEGFAIASTTEARQAWMKQLTTVLLLAVLGAFLLFLLVGMQTGLIGNLFSGLAKFIHGG